MKITKSQLKQIIKEELAEQEEPEAVRRARRRAPFRGIPDQSLTPQQKKDRINLKRIQNAPSTSTLGGKLAPGPYKDLSDKDGYTVTQADVDDMKDVGFDDSEIQNMIALGISDSERAEIKQVARDARARRQGKISPALSYKMDRMGAIEVADEAEAEGQFQSLARMATGDLDKDDNAAAAFTKLQIAADESPYAQAMLDAVMNIQRQRLAKKERGSMSPAEFQALGGEPSFEDEDEAFYGLDESKLRKKTKITKSQLKQIIKEELDTAIGYVQDLAADSAKQPKKSSALRDLEGGDVITLKLGSGIGYEDFNAPQIKIPVKLALHINTHLEDKRGIKMAVQKLLHDLEAQGIRHPTIRSYVNEINNKFFGGYKVARVPE
jgi:hypothetical protein